MNGSKYTLEKTEGQSTIENPETHTTIETRHTNQNNTTQYKNNRKISIKTKEREPSCQRGGQAVPTSYRKPHAIRIYCNILSLQNVHGETTTKAKAINCKTEF